TSIFDTRKRRKTEDGRTKTEDRRQKTEDKRQKTEARRDATLPNEFRVRRRVQFSETDAAGIVHFACFFRYFEDAEHALWRDAGLSIHSEDSSIGWPRISASCEFLRPLKFEHEVDVSGQISEITKRDTTYSGKVIADSESFETW